MFGCNIYVLKNAKDMTADFGIQVYVVAGQNNLSVIMPRTSIPTAALKIKLRFIDSN
ncbi:hypothetical protein J6590_090909 [Homalodisca vitripennis]|nr:hypothetical protein J6590_090909 [Homalodisca vitripennis]